MAKRAHVDIGLVHELFDGVGHAAAGTTDRQYASATLGAPAQSLRPNHQPVNPAWMPALISRTWVPPDRLAAILSRDSAARSAPASFCGLFARRVAGFDVSSSL